MTQSGVLLLLDAPLQSWGTQSRFGHRDTDFEPSKSGVLGLVGAAMGMSRDNEELLQRLANLTMAVRVDREGRILRDYHTAGGGTYRGEEHGVYGSKDTVVTNRFYLMDACFVAALSGEDGELVDQICTAMKNPRWPLFLGRRSCAPTRHIFLDGPMQGCAKELLRRVRWQGGTGEPPDVLRCVVDDPQGKPRADVPRSFRRYARKFENRLVCDEWIPTKELPGDEDVPVPSVAQ